MAVHQNAPTGPGDGRPDTHPDTRTGTAPKARPTPTTDAEHAHLAELAERIRDRGLTPTVDAPRRRVIARQPALGATPLCRGLSQVVILVRHRTDPGRLAWALDFGDGFRGESGTTTQPIAAAGEYDVVADRLATILAMTAAPAGDAGDAPAP